MHSYHRQLIIGKRHLEYIGDFLHDGVLFSENVYGFVDDTMRNKESERYKDHKGKTTKTEDENVSKKTEQTGLKHRSEIN